MKKIILSAVALSLFATTSFADSQYTTQVSEAYSVNEDCHATVTGSATVTIHDPAPGGLPTAECHGSVTYTFTGPGCIGFEGSFVVVFNYIAPNNGSSGTLTGANNNAQQWLLSHPREAAKLKAALKSKIHY